MIWDDIAIARLRELWAEGLSTAKIGRDLGCTKCSVTGKASRLDLPMRASPIAWPGGVRPPQGERKLPVKPERMGRDKPPPPVMIEVGRTGIMITSTKIERIKYLAGSPVNKSDGEIAIKTGTKLYVVRIILGRPLATIVAPKRPQAPTPRQIRPILVPGRPSGKSCQWMGGGIAMERVCGAPATAFRDDGSCAPEGAVWCAAHRRLVYPRQQAERKAA